MPTLYLPRPHPSGIFSSDLRGRLEEAEKQSWSDATRLGRRQVVYNEMYKDPTAVQIMGFLQKARYAGRNICRTANPTFQEAVKIRGELGRVSGRRVDNFSLPYIAIWAGQFNAEVIGRHFPWRGSFAYIKIDPFDDDEEPEVQAVRVSAPEMPAGWSEEFNNGTTRVLAPVFNKK